MEGGREGGRGEREGGRKGREGGREVHLIALVVCFRDDPSSSEFLLVSNNSENDGELQIEGTDLFSAVR